MWSVYCVTPTYTGWAKRHGRIERMTLKQANSKAALMAKRYGWWYVARRVEI